MADIHYHINGDFIAGNQTIIKDSVFHKSPIGETVSNPLVPAKEGRMCTYQATDECRYSGLRDGDPCKEGCGQRTPRSLDQIAKEFWDAPSYDALPDWIKEEWV